MTVGGTGAVPSDLFNKFGYTALGHLHRPQQLNDGLLAYSGSPMSYSFSEEHQKSVRVIEVTESAITSSELNIDVGRPVVTIKDTFEKILNAAKYEVHINSFVRAFITDSNFKVGAMESLRQRFPNILDLQQIAISQQSALKLEKYGDFAKRSEKEIVDSYVDETFEENLDDFGLQFINHSLEQALRGDH